MGRLSEFQASIRAWFKSTIVTWIWGLECQSNAGRVVELGKQGGQESHSERVKGSNDDIVTGVRKEDDGKDGWVARAVMNDG